MASTFTIATNINFDDPTLRPKWGNDVYNINGGTLTIDSDTRYALNSIGTSGVSGNVMSYGASAVVGNITISPTLGGTVIVDGTKVRQIPFSGGSGTVPVYGSTITQGSVSGTFLGVWQAPYYGVNTPGPSGTPIVSGGNMPVSGFIKLKNLSSKNAFTAGALTGITATATSGDVPSWIEVVGFDAATCTVPRLGTFTVTGDWYLVGYTSGSSNQLLQLPQSMGNTYYPGVWIEDSVGSNTYTFFPNAGSATVFATNNIYGRVCWISSASVLRIGNSGALTAGYTPVAGCRIRIPNVVFTCSSNIIANVLPNATLATRYDFTTTSAGAININQANMSWYPSFVQPYSLIIKDTSIFEQLYFDEVATRTIINNVGVGQTAANAQNALLVTTCFAGADITKCVFSRATAANATYCNSLTNIAGFNFFDVTSYAMAVRSGATYGSWLTTNAYNCNWVDCEDIGGGQYLTTCTNCSLSACDYYDAPINIPQTAINPQYAYTIQTKCNNITIDNIKINTEGISAAPYSGIVNINNCDNITVKNMGSPLLPTNLGTPVASASRCLVNFTGNSSNITLKRLYTTNLGTGLFITGTNNTDTGITVENCWSTSASALNLGGGRGGVGWQNLNAIYKGMYCDATPFGATENTNTQTSYTSVYGNIFRDHYYSANSGRLVLAFNETGTLQSYTVSAGNPRFTSTGSLLLTNVGDSVVYEWPYYIKGYSGFQNQPPSAAGVNLTPLAGNIGNYGAHNFRYTIDKNDGSGYASGWTNLSAQSVSAITGITASGGFKIKLLVECVSANPSNALSGFTLLTKCTTADQLQQYPLATVSASLTLTGLPLSADVSIYDSTTTQLLSSTDSTTSSTYTYNYTWSGTDTNVFIVVVALGYLFLRYDNQVLGQTGLTIPVLLSQDRQYYNPP